MKVTKLSNTEAKQFFLKEKSYCYIDLPHYFSFSNLLNNVTEKIGTHSMSDFFSDTSAKLSDLYGINYLLFSNKDGKFEWRPLQLIHPIIYVSLVNKICEEKNWHYIVKKFKEYGNSKVNCISIPAQSETKESDKAESIINWCSNFEKQSIRLGLEYQYMLKTDITNCYGSIYTHSIAWALHGKAKAKKAKKDDLIGNIIDRHIQNMSYGQTNGIPQGSVLMDFIAEIILGYADVEFTKLLDDTSVYNISDIKILRYRDDYRIFSNNPKTLEVAIKYLTEVLIDLGLKINSAKTCISDNIIKDALKSDKFFWINNKQIRNNNYQKNLHYLHSFAESFPNSGTLVKELFNFYKKIKPKKYIKGDIIVMSSIVTDIMYKNPKVYPQCSAILSKLLDMIDFNEAKDILKLIIERLKYVPNATLLNIWLQRIARPFKMSISFDNKICRKVIDANVSIWESTWLRGNFKKLVDETDIINREAFDELSKVVNVNEIQLFEPYYNG